MSTLAIDASLARLATLSTAAAPDPAGTREVDGPSARHAPYASAADGLPSPQQRDDPLDGAKAAAVDAPADDTQLRTGTLRDGAQQRRTAAPALTAPRISSGYRFVYRSSYNYGSSSHGSHVSVGVRVKLRPKPAGMLPSLEPAQPQLAQVNQHRWQQMRAGIDQLMADMRRQVSDAHATRLAGQLARLVAESDDAPMGRHAIAVTGE